MPEEPPNSKKPQNLPSSSSSSSSEFRNVRSNPKSDFSGQRAHFPNPPEHSNPDPAALRDQWRYAIRQYSKWYSHAWGTAILAGLSFFALGWVIKGSNPIPSLNKESSSSSSSTSSPADDKESRR